MKRTRWNIHIDIKVIFGRFVFVFFVCFFYDDTKMFNILFCC